MATRRPSYSTPSTGSFSAAQWPPHSYGSSSYSPPHNPYPSSYAPPSAVSQSIYADMGMHNTTGGVPLPNESYNYVSTPRSALGGSAPSTGARAVDAYGYPASEPIAIARSPTSASSSSSSYHQHQHHHQQQSGHHPSQAYITTSSPPSHAQAFAPSTSPQSPSSPHSPISQLSAFAYVPASPQRPFACDMCALSFSRQHDLKRHRDTHSGEKPFFCNGGCGKQFTRKDALKRHQLVKRCGTEDN